jgi:hypothetical protein
MAVIGSKYLLQVLADVLFGIVVKTPFLVNTQVPKLLDQFLFKLGGDVPYSPVP